MIDNESIKTEGKSGEKEVCLNLPSTDEILNLARGTNKYLPNISTPLMKSMDDFKKDIEIMSQNSPLIECINNLKKEIMSQNSKFIKNINKMNNNLCDMLKFSISKYNIYNSLNINQIKKILNGTKDIEIQNCAILGSYGWSYYFIEDIDDEDITDMTFPKEWEKSKHKIKTIDKYIGRRISKQTLLNIISKTELLLDNDDLLKLKSALMHYNSKKYYDCCSLLLGMIDSQNIKQELYDYKNGYYSTLNIHNGEENIDQGWNAFAIVFRNHLMEYFNNEKFIGKNKNNKSKNEHFESFVNKVKYDMDNDIGFYFLCIAYPLLTLFNDCKWKEYINGNKPSVINRNWLMHGMYSISDIDRYDCIKLFLILYQISNLFYKIKNN